MFVSHLLVMGISALAATSSTKALSPDEQALRKAFSSESQIVGETFHAGPHNRMKRQLRRNQNIFGLLFQLIGETRRDIQKTINDIARQIESSIVDENSIQTNATDGEGRSSSSERQPITRQELTRILSRNWQGLTKLFNREVEIALEQSNRSAADARQAFWNSLAPFLQPATTTARTTTTTTSRTTEASTG